MNIDLTCQKCEGTFELDAQDLIDGTEKLACPHCSVKAPSNIHEDFVAALTEMRIQVAALSKRFSVSMSLETEDLEDELDEDETPDKDEEESDDEELDFDEDEDVEDDEDYDEDEDDER